MTKTFLAVGLLASGCAWQGTPIPVEGDVQLLAGEWEGTYFSPQTGRSGSILFRLKAGADSAYGDVVMVPTRPEELQHPLPTTHPPAAAPIRQLPRVLRISFVRCQEGIITGVLEPYEDPDTGEWVTTTFEGRLAGSEFLGTFSSHYRAEGQRISGTWSAQRKKEGKSTP